MENSDCSILSSRISIEQANVLSPELNLMHEDFSSYLPLKYFDIRPPLKCSKVLSLLSFHLQTQTSKRVPSRTTSGKLSNTPRYLIFRLCALSATTVLQLSPWLISSKISTSLHTPCMDFVLHLHFYWNKNNSIPHEIFEIKLRTLVNAHLVDVSTTLLVGTLTQEEKELKLILFLS
jgi:hypothetical protein